MSNNLSFDDAWKALQQLVEDIEGDEIPLEELAGKVKEAKELVKYCEAKLKGIEADLKALKDEDNVV